MKSFKKSTVEFIVLLVLLSSFIPILLVHSYVVLNPEQMDYMPATYHKRSLCNTYGGCGSKRSLRFGPKLGPYDANPTTMMQQAPELQAIELRLFEGPEKSQV